MIAIVLSMVIGGLAGAIIGFVLGMLGFSAEIIKGIVGILGLLIGVVGSIFPVKMVLGKDYGEFRLVLVAKQSPIQPPDQRADVQARI